MILEIPLQQVPNQTFGVTLGGSDYELTLSYRLGQTFLSVVKDNEPIIYNRICQDNNPIGQFGFVDISGTKNPVYTGFNDRFKLVWSDGVAWAASSHTLLLALPTDLKFLIRQNIRFIFPCVNTE